VLLAELVVAVGEHQQRAQSADPPPQEGQQVERRPVGPVQVLDHQNRPRPVRRRVQHVQQRGEQRLPRRVPGQRGGQLAAGLPPDVVQRTQLTRGQQRVARAEEHPHVRPGPRRERRDQRGLAHPGLTADQRHSPGVRGPQPVEPAQRFDALQRADR
jgi:hypothetical protein